MDECPRCGLPLISTDKAQMDQPLPVRTLIVRTLIVLLGILITAALFTFAGVRVYYWRDAKRLERDYVNHTIELITMDNGVQGHAISFFGKDGDSVYIEELGKSYQYIGGVARVEFADYIWFDSDPEDIESAELTISPVHISAAGRKTRLPAFTINVPVPEAPVTITSSSTSGHSSKARTLRSRTVSPPRSKLSLSNPIRVEEPAATRTAVTRCSNFLHLPHFIPAPCRTAQSILLFIEYYSVSTHKLQLPPPIKNAPVQHFWRCTGA